MEMTLEICYCTAYFRSHISEFGLQVGLKKKYLLSYLAIKNSSCHDTSKKDESTLLTSVRCVCSDTCSASEKSRWGPGVRMTQDLFRLTSRCKHADHC